jgi:hypothetical protein
VTCSDPKAILRRIGVSIALTAVVGLGLFGCGGGDSGGSSSISGGASDGAGRSLEEAKAGAE